IGTRPVQGLVEQTVAAEDEARIRVRPLARELRRVLGALGQRDCQLETLAELLRDRSQALLGDTARERVDDQGRGLHRREHATARPRGLKNQVRLYGVAYPRIPSRSSSYKRS